MDFNQTIKEKLTEYIDRIIQNILSKDDSKEYVSFKLKGTRHDEGDPQTFVNGVGDDSTCWNELTYELTYKKDGEDMTIEGKLKVPYMMSGGIFIIDGKSRIATNAVETSYDCSYAAKKRKFQINNQAFLYQDDGSIVVEYYKRDENMYATKVTSAPIICQKDLDGLQLDLVPSEEQRNRLLYLLDIPWEDREVSIPKGEALSFAFIKGIDSSEAAKRNRDSVANLEIYEVGKSLMDSLTKVDSDDNTNPKITIYNGIKRGLIKDELNLGSAMGHVMRFLRNPSNEGVDVATVVNPLVYDQLHGKIILPEYLTYNYSFSDIIDAPNTPENGNVNRVNELNVCITQEDGKIFIDCYEFPSGKKVKVPYHKYINEYALRAEEWDYDEKHLVNPEALKYRVKYHVHTKELSLSGLKKVKYIEPKVDERFSISSRTIPFLNSSDSVRIAINNLVA